MARTGRPRLPTKLHIVRGNPGHRPLPKNEPKPREVPPSRPTWLSEAAAAEWDNLVPELERMRLLSVVDGAALGVFCQAVADLAFLRGVIDDYRETAGKLTREYVADKGGGKEIPIPELALADRCVQIIRAFAIEFGLTPSSRGSLKGPRDAKDKGSLEDFIAKGNKAKA